MRVRNYVAQAALKSWIEGSDSFEDFYRDVRRLVECPFPNELGN